MKLEPDDFWSFYEWLVRPGAFLESALLQGVVLIVLAITLGLLIGYLISAVRYGPGEGFYAVARTIRDLVRFDLPGTSIRRVLALARLAFKEAIRRKVLYVVGLFVVILLFAGWFLNRQSDDPSRLYISFVLTATNYLVLVLALFISAFSLPEDIRAKTIYTIVTKPVRPTELILGRMLGFVGVGTLILVPMGLLSYIFVVRGLSHQHLEIADAAEREGGGIAGETEYLESHSHNHRFTIDSGSERGLSDFVRGHRHVVARTGEGTYQVGPAVDALRARVPSYGEILFFDRAGEQKDEGIDVGAERLPGGYGSAGLARFVGVTRGTRRAEHGYVEGGTLGKAEFTFTGVTPQRYPRSIPVDLSVRAFRSYKGDIETGIRGSLTMKHPDQDAESEPIPFIVDEYVVDEKYLPLEIEGNVGGETRMLDVFEDLVSEDGRLTIVLRCLDRQQYLGVTRSSVYLRPAESRFAWNITKAYTSIWLQMTMVIAFGVMFSTFLSGPVAMIATGVCVLLGFSAEQVYDTRYYIDEGISRGGGPIESLVRLLKQDAVTTELDVETTTAIAIKTVDAGIVYAIDAIATALPNLPKMVATAEYAASGFDIFGALLLRHGAATLGYSLLAFMVSYFFIKSREIAA